MICQDRRFDPPDKRVIVLDQTHVKEAEGPPPEAVRGAAVEGDGEPAF